MRSSKRSWVRRPSALRALAGLVLIIVLAGLLAGCPSKAPGHLRIEIRATNTDRCDNGIKVEVDLNTAGLSQGPPESIPESEYVYGGGSNWLWVKPGKVAYIGWIDDPYDRILPSGPLAITAWCMRTGGQAPGKSERTFDLNKYIWNSTHVLVATFTIRDMSADPDTSTYAGYSEVTSPAPSIFDWDEWCQLGDPGDCSDIE